MVTDVYSKQDGTRNRKIEIKQAQLIRGIFIICLCVFWVVAGIYYFNTHTIEMAKTPSSVVEAQTPAIVSDKDHTYNTSVPPYK